jgi:hypothetical protein
MQYQFMVELPQGEDRGGLAELLEKYGFAVTNDLPIDVGRQPPTDLYIASGSAYDERLHAELRERGYLVFSNPSIHGAR